MANGVPWAMPWAGCLWLTVKGIEWPVRVDYS